MKQKTIRSFAVVALVFGPLLISSQAANANDVQAQIDSVNQQMNQTPYLSPEWLSLYNQKGSLQIELQVCTRDNSCGGASTPTPTQSSTPTQPSTPAPSQSSTPAPSSSPSTSPAQSPAGSNPASSATPAPSASSTPTPTSSSQQGSSGPTTPLLTYDEYVKQVQSIDAKLVSSTGSERTALLNQKNAVVAQYQSDNSKAQQKYVAVQQEYVQQLAVITAKNQAEAQAKLIETAKQEALNAGVSANQLSSWTAVQTDLQQKVAQLEQVISSYDAIYTAESIASMNLDTVDQTVSQAVAYKEELKLQSLTLSSVAMDSLSTVQATSLTSEQKNVLVTAASISFEYAQQGSLVYIQAMDALFTVAQSDDPSLLAEVAAIPLVGAALEGVLDAFNYLGNAGSDMSPQVREQSEKVIVSAVIVGQVTQVAVGASTISASATSSAAIAAMRRP